jgi:hypothetical protein
VSEISILRRIFSFFDVTNNRLNNGRRIICPENNIKSIRNGAVILLNDPCRAEEKALVRPQVLQPPREEYAQLTGRNSNRITTIIEKVMTMINKLTR